ncbi:glycosyltransferase [Smaragdicoccus niigatensis]|uniref:glycosyltransferase n=1 Tax=Smaragdicoccus niigatensis TaxID=359359 RepID=UPI00037E1BFE|nr:glycosyltransferase [Smaragdicoccus niigatensis]
MTKRFGFPIAAAGASLAVSGAVIAVHNLRAFRFLDPTADTSENVAVLIPARNQALEIPDLIADLKSQIGVSEMSVVILDDDSSDETFDAAVSACREDARFQVHRQTGDPLPGWLGKSAACHELAQIADDASILVFIDADVRLEPHAINAAVGALRSADAALISPWPQQIAESPAERLLQPLLAWSWASTLPVSVANRSRRPSMAVACGQFLVFDARAYRQIGGHASVASSITEDLAIARELRRNGHRTELVGAGSLAQCRMYDGWGSAQDGYSKWLWSQFGSLFGSLGVLSGLSLGYLIPPVAMIAGKGRVRAVGTVGVVAAIGSRVAAAALERRTYPQAVDLKQAAKHPASIAAYSYLTLRSHYLHRRGKLAWRGRSLRT